GAGEEAVHVVPHGHRPEDRRGRCVSAVAGGERQVEEDRQRSQADVTNGVRDRPGPQGLARSRLARRGTGAVEAELAAEPLAPPPDAKGLSAAAGHLASIWKARRKPGSPPLALRT